MAGAPSQLDLFDPKPMLAKLEGKPLPPSVIGGQRYAFIRPDADVLGPRFKFNKAGKCGADLAEVLPHLAEVVDDVCLIRSVQTDQFNHAPAQIFLNTGFAQPGRPSLGSWVVYGLGRRARTCPPSWSCPRAAASAAARPTGRAVFCPRSTPASACATARPDPQCLEPARHRREAATRLARPGRGAQPHAA